MQKNVLTGDVLVLQFAPTDDAGKPEPVQTINWSSTDETVATVEPSDDQMSATVTVVGLAGTAASIIVTAYPTDVMNNVVPPDQKSNAEPQPIPQQPLSDQLDMTVVPAHATALNLSIQTS